ncbi:MAG: hypothetical protein FWF96_04750, partial [Kiritimatiellaeota bacterium]|nr:hypothetical protein [Kiritimatiellota bacterium]
MSDYDKSPPPPQEPPPPPSKKEPEEDEPLFNKRLVMSWAVIAAVVLGSWMLMKNNPFARKVDELSYSDFTEKTAKGEIETANVTRVSSTETFVTGKYKLPGEEVSRQYKASVYANERLIENLQGSGVRVGKIETPSNVLPMIFWNVVPFVLVAGLFYFLFLRKMGGGGGGGNPFSFGKSR